MGNLLIFLAYKCIIYMLKEIDYKTFLKLFLGEEEQE